MKLHKQKSPEIRAFLLNIPYTAIAIVYKTRIKLLQENDLVALLADLPGVSLIRGDIGTIDHIYQSSTRYEVEFVNAKGDTIAVETLTSDQIKKVVES